MNRWTVLLLALLCAVLVMPVASAQAPKESELKAEVPALTAMHEVIMPMWHEAWPNKDVAALAALLPKVEKHLAAITKAELPGILRDKTEAWKDGVAKLTGSVAAYKSAVKAKDDAGLLKAAEALHRDYEALNKIVQPPLKEMDDFHSSLYVLYHYQTNPLDLKGAGETVAAMLPKMGALNAVVLPERLKARQESFAAQRARLAKAVDAVAAVMASRDEPRIKEAIELMHLEYEKLEKVF